MENVPDTSHQRDRLEAAYRRKPSTYFANCRSDIVEMLPTGPDSSILELGCGEGATGLAVLTAGKAGRYVGIELDHSAAKRASLRLSSVLVGDVAYIDLDPYLNAFDALVLSEVVEHLLDPWSVLHRLSMCLKPHGIVFSSSPNIAHWRVIRDLVLGRFRYQKSGVMDETHLRWFTPESYRALFESSGFEVRKILPVRPPGWKARAVSKATRKRFDHLFMTQMMIVGGRR